jgi:hypothetical protein
MQKTFKKNNLSFLLFCMGVSFIYVHTLRMGFDNQGKYIPEMIRALLVITGPLFFSLSVLAALREGQLRKLKSHYRKWLLMLLLTTILMFISGAVVFGNEIRRIVLDFTLFSPIFAGILVGVRKENWLPFDKFLLAIFQINIIICLVGLKEIASVFSTLDIPSRADLWARGFSLMSEGNSMIYHFWGVLDVWPYFLLTIREGTRLRKATILIGIGMYFILSIIFQKRAPFILLIGFTLFLLIKMRLKRLLALCAVGLITGAVVLYVFTSLAGPASNELLGQFNERFGGKSGVVDTLSQEDRLNYDYWIVFNQLSPIELFNGRGMGGTVSDIGGFYHWTGEDNIQMTHNGTALIILKGGFTFLIIWVVGWLMFTKDFLLSGVPGRDRFFIPVLMVFGLSWLGPFISNSISFALLMMCAGRIMARDAAELQRAPIQIMGK